MREGLVGLRHPVEVVLLLERAALRVESVHDLAGELVDHRLLAAVAGVRHEPADGERAGAALRHLDGQTGNVPVVLLYPGTKQGPTSLSFMGVLNPDSDYRPRITADPQWIPNSWFAPRYDPAALQAGLVRRLALRDAEHLRAAAEDHAAHGADVHIVAAPADRDVLAGGEDVVGRVEVHPSSAGGIHREPRVRGLRADIFDIGARRVEMAVVGHDVAGLKPRRRENALGGAALMGGKDMAEAGDVLDRRLEAPPGLTLVQEEQQEAPVQEVEEEQEGEESRQGERR